MNNLFPAFFNLYFQSLSVNRTYPAKNRLKLVAHRFYNFVFIKASKFD